MRDEFLPPVSAPRDGLPSLGLTDVFLARSKGADGVQVFVDESKARGLLLVAAIVAPSDAREARRTVRDLIMPGQQRVHFKSERDSRRRDILSAFTRAGFTTVLYQALPGFKRQLDSRAACLESLVLDLVDAETTLLCLESDESIDARDRQQLYSLTRRAGRSDLPYRHTRAAQEPLLAIPDAVAWAWPKGGTWRARAEPLVSRVVEVGP